MEGETVVPVQVLMKMSNHSLNDTFDEGVLKLQQPWRWELQDHPQFRTYWFENHDNQFWRKFVWEHPLYPYIAIVLYLTTIFGIKAWMKDRPPYKLKKPLFIWNVALGIFSIFGFYRIAQEFAVIYAQENGLHKSACEKGYHYHPAAAWGLAFV